MAYSARIRQPFADRRDSDRDGLQRLFPVVYRELDRIAALKTERSGSVDQVSPAELADEAFARLVDQGSLCMNDRQRFLAVCGTAMRRILVRRARTGTVRTVDAPPMDAVSAKRKTDRLLRLNDALAQLARIEKRMARVAELRFFGGLTDDEVARQLDIDERTVKRDWYGAKALLTLAIADSEEQTDDSRFVAREHARGIRQQPA